MDWPFVKSFIGVLKEHTIWPKRIAPSASDILCVMWYPTDSLKTTRTTPGKHLRACQQCAAERGVSLTCKVPSPRGAFGAAAGSVSPGATLHLDCQAQTHKSLPPHGQRWWRVSSFHAALSHIDPTTKKKGSDWEFYIYLPNTEGNKEKKINRACVIFEKVQQADSLMDWDITLVLSVNIPKA